MKKEGKLLTGKQKEEAKRLAAVREQMLKQAGVKLDGDEAAPKKQKVSGVCWRRLVLHPHLTTSCGLHESSGLMSTKYSSGIAQGSTEVPGYRCRPGACEALTQKIAAVPVRSPGSFWK